jgi:oxygen-independent coproporphyrinogen-3 oxidase
MGADWKADERPVAVYVHSPFCPSKCPYCDFNSFAMTGDILERTSRAMAEEVRRSPWRGRPAKTVFFGGGTPTFFETGQLLRVLDAVLEAHPPVAGAEITSEANPGTADAAKFAAMRAAGFNRISLGAQSFVKEDLARLGRVHDAADIGAAVRAARVAGFDNLNLDLMFALPGQTAAAWRRNLELAFLLQPEHLSLYCLTIEPNTLYYRLHLRGALHLPDDEAQARQYDIAVAEAEARGYRAYEISNFARPGRECAHNLCYWRAEEYAGYGPGAVGRIGAARYTNAKHPARYCEAVETGGDLWCDSETVDPATLRVERIMLGLRLAEGIPAEGLDRRALGRMAARRWIAQDGGRVRLTPQGRHFCTEVAAELS